MKSTTTTLHHRRIVVLRVFLVGVALCFNYFLLSTTNVVFRHHQKKSSTEIGSFLDGTAPPPTTRRGNADERNIANNAPGTEEAGKARRDLIDCGIIVDHHRSNNDGTTADDPPSSHHGHSSSCDLTDLRWGTPAILISLGRSGSTATWQLMSGMTGEHTFPATEDTGSSTAESVRIFDEVFDRMGDDGKCWIQELLCLHQGRNRARDGGGRPMAGLYGFKWKPYAATFGSTRSVDALRWLSRNPHVRVVRNVRNPLDVIISRYKHKDGRVVAHCGVGDAACTELHQNAKPSLPTKGGRLVRLIHDIEEESNAAGRLLKELDVPHLNVRYEDLYFAADIAIEWRKVFAFLGVGPYDDTLTSSILTMRMEHQATSNHSTPIREKVQNYEEVEDALRGTEYEVFLSGDGG